MIYAGVGARKTPKDMCIAMCGLANYLASQGHHLRSGGADGADIAFERGCDQANGSKEIFLPYKGFNGNQSPLYGTARDARMLAKQFHPKWAVLGDKGRDFMGRNSYQILGGALLRPADFLVCWTPKGRITGGTGQALRMADHYRIPIFNLGGEDSLDVLSDQIQDFIS